MKPIKLISISLILIFVLSFLACGGGKDETSLVYNDHLKTISFDPQQNSQRKELKLTYVSFLKLKGPKGFSTTDISDLLFTEHNIYVIGFNSFSIFDRNGSLKKIVELGSGGQPTTEKIIQAKINSKIGGIDLLINDGETILSYDSLGRLNKSHSLTCQVFNFHSVRGNYLFHNGFHLCGIQELKQGYSHRLTVTSLDYPSQISHSFLKFKFKGLQSPTAITGLMNFSDVNGKNDSILVFENFCDTIYSFSNGKLSSKYLMEFKGESTRLSTILTNQRILDKSKAIKAQKVTSLSNVIENDKFVSLSYQFFSKKLGMYVKNNALFDKERNDVYAYGGPLSFFTKSGNTVVRFDLNTYPMYINSSGHFVSYIIPSEINVELKNEIFNKNFNGPIHQMVKKFNLNESLIDERPILFIYNFK